MWKLQHTLTSILCDIVSPMRNTRGHFLTSDLEWKQETRPHYKIYSASFNNEYMHHFSFQIILYNRFSHVIFFIQICNFLYNVHSVLICYYTVAIYLLYRNGVEIELDNLEDI